MFGESVTILTAGTVTDPYSGELVRSWATSTGVTVTTLAPAEPRPSGEPVQDARNAVTSGFTLYLPLGTAVTPANRITVRGRTYDVLGEPAEWRGGTLGGLVVQTERVEG